MEPGTKTRRATVSVVLPSGVFSRDFTVLVAEGWKEICISAKCSLPLGNLVILNRKWLNADNSVCMETHHPKFFSFKAALKERKEQSSGDVYSFTTITRPLPVKAHI